MASPQRRRIEPHAPQDTSGRWGCITAGAVLGIAIGAIFAFYALPPILRSVYGETKVGFGQSYSGDAREISILAVERNGQEVAIRLQALTNKTWRLEASDFSLQLSNGGDWIEAQPPVPGDSASSLDFELGVRRELVVSFHIPTGRTGDPESLHLSTPRVRFALAE